MTKKRLVLGLVVTCCIAFAACFIWPHIPLTSSEKQRLDELRPESVVRTYLQARDARVRTYLLSREYIQAQAGAIGGREYGSRVSNVVVDSADSWEPDLQDGLWSEQVVVGVEFDSSVHSGNGDSPGHQTRWFILGRMPNGKGWRILDEATGL